MSHLESDLSTPTGPDGISRLLQIAVDQMEQSNRAWDGIAKQAIPLLERIAIALERAASLRHPSESAILVPSSQRTEGGAILGHQTVTADVRAAIDEKRWDRAQSILDGLSIRGEADPQVASLSLELERSRDRAIADLSARIDAARLINDADSALSARDELALILRGDALVEVDRAMITWLMKLIRIRLRSIPVGSDLAALAGKVADRFGGTPEGASIRAALPTLRRSAGLCPRCSEPYVGFDDACPKCLAESGQTPGPVPTLTFVTDDLDAVVGDAKPVDLNNVEIWQLP